MTKRLNAVLVRHGMQDRLSVHFLARQMLSRGRPVHRVRGKQSVYSGLLLKVHAEDPTECTLWYNGTVFRRRQPPLKHSMRPAVGVGEVWGEAHGEVARHRFPI